MIHHIPTALTISQKTIAGTQTENLLPGAIPLIQINDGNSAQFQIVVQMLLSGEICSHLKEFSMVFSNFFVCLNILFYNELFLDIWNT